MAGRIRDFDWASTPLGSIARWPQSLKTTVDLMLASPSMMSLVWGAEAIHLYNDGFTELLREHRVLALGRSAYETFAQSRDEFEADLAAGMAGRSARLPAQRYPVLRNGRIENAWFDVDYAPIRDEAGSVAGVLWTLKETTAQHLAERALRASETRHRLLIESWAQAEWEADGQGVVIADSPSWRAYTGQTLEEWLGYGWLDAVHPDDRAYAERQWREAVAARGLFNAEFRIRAPGGGWRWTNVRAAPVIDTGGHVEKWAGMNIDIDARKRAEAALRGSEERFRTMADNAPVLIWETDQDGATSVNRHYTTFFGVSIDEVIGMGWAKFLHPDDAQGYIDTYMDAFERRTVYAHECRFLRADGQYRWLRNSGGPVGGSRFVGCSLDVTDLLNAREALQESEELRRIALESGEMGAWTWNIREQSVRADAVVQKLWGLSIPDQPHSVSLYAELMTPEGVAWLEAGMTNEIAPGEAVHSQMQVAHGPAAGRWVQLRGRAERDRPWIINGVSFDITEDKAAARRQEVLVNELQHRARNLLGVVTAVAGRTLRDGGGSVDAFDERLQALSRAQGLLSQQGSDMVEVGSLVRAELAALAQDGLDRVYVAGPEMQLTARQVQNFALALHELATNAVKYGALKREAGHLAVTWEIVQDKRGRSRLALNWIESGVAVDLDKVRRRGYGTELIEEALAYALEADVEYELGIDGVRCRIEMPIQQPE